MATAASASRLGLALALAACGGSGAKSPDAATTCELTANTASGGVVTNGCALLDRDTSACATTRSAAGLTGAWLHFSCRVTLTAGATTVALASDDQPDYASNYFATTDPCYAPFTPSFPDPNHIAAQAFTLSVPLAPDTTAHAMGLGPVGMAVDGVAIFDNQAAPGDDIFDEVGSFDECAGHPQMSGAYHYHTEPYAISSDDDRLIGVLADGYFVYGRLDADGSTPTLDAAGGHVGTTPDSPGTAVYHHHLVLQMDTKSSASAWFLTTGTYAGTPGSATL